MSARPGRRQSSTTVQQASSIAARLARMRRFMSFSTKIGGRRVPAGSSERRGLYGGNAVSTRLVARRRVVSYAPTRRTATSYAPPRADLTPLSVRPRCRGRRAPRCVPPRRAQRRAAAVADRDLGTGRRRRDGQDRPQRGAGACDDAVGLRRQRADGGAAADRGRRAGRDCAADRHHRQSPLRHLLRDACGPTSVTCRSHDGWFSATSRST